MNYNIDQNGYYGDFGGAYIPEMLYPNIFELKQKYMIAKSKIEALNSSHYEKI